MDQTKLQTLKGFRDFLPQEARKRQYAIAKIVEVFEYYGFDPLETPTLEYQGVLLGKYGAEADKLVFKFEDEGGRKVALRYDQTVPVARVLAQYGQELPMPFKRYQIQSAFRAEKPQKGRFREFLQCDIDIVGANPPLPDAEILAVLFNVYQNLGVKNFKIKINDRKDLFALLAKAGVPKDKELRATQIIDKLDKAGDEKVRAMLSQATNPDVASSVLKLLSNNPTPSPELEAISGKAFKLGVPEDCLTFSPYLARGLDYYTGLIMEGVIDGYEGGSVFGGGRFDQLIGQLSGGKVDLPAVGVSIGIDRTVAALDSLKLLPESKTAAQVLVTIFDSELADASLALATTLRDNGLKVELYPSLSTKLDKQLKFADKKGIPFVLIIGAKEAQTKTATLKNMASGDQQTLPLDKLADVIKS
ncbi:MAG: histidine--tRNA ligase [Candidatus Chisholmbacteria bacterium]|nr:histidine--tRNA ligase [Candidatus Chisholmbacteria bacterium]